MSFGVLGVGRWVSAARPGRRKGGFPPGGPWDAESFELACTLAGVERAFELDTGRLTFSGPAVAGLVGVGRGEVRNAEAGDVIDASRRLYVALSSQGARSARPSATRVAEGIESPGHNGILRLAEPPGLPPKIRILKGPQGELLNHLLDREFTVDRQSDRTGVRLSQTESHSLDLPSEPATPGAIQLTPNGTPIILGPDGPTIGGYPKPAVVIRADRDLTGRLMPLDRVTFELATVEEARSLWQEREAKRLRNLGQVRLAVNAFGF